VQFGNPSFNMGCIVRRDAGIYLDKCHNFCMSRGGFRFFLFQKIEPRKTVANKFTCYVTVQAMEVMELFEFTLVGYHRVQFFEGGEPCEISNAEKEGKYKKQQLIMLPVI
jgi:hypothetical protein